MKLSNKILIVFFSVLFLYLISAFSEIRLRGTPNTLDSTNAIIETKSVPDFKVLEVQALGYHAVNLLPSDTVRVEVRSLSGGLIDGLKYEIEADTLKITEFKNDMEKRVSIYIYFSADSFNQLTASGVDVRVGGLKKGEFRILQNSGNVHLKEDTSIGKISAKISGDARLSYSGDRLESFSGELNDAYVAIYKGADLVEGHMENNSYLQVYEAKHLDFKKDETSQLYIN